MTRPLSAPDMTATSADHAASRTRIAAMPRRSWSSRGPSAVRLAQAACVVGLLFAAVSVYWGLGGTSLLDTIGGSLEREGRAGEAGVMTALWVAAVLKVIAAVLPLVALRRLACTAWSRNLWVLAWIAAASLTLYGLAQTTVGLLIQADIVHASADADHRALAWHAFLWDPWFLIWGLLAVAALLRGRHLRSQARSRA